MKHFSLLTALAAIAVLLTACSESNDLSLPPQANQNTSDNAVQFSTYMGRVNTTRGGAYGSINTTKLAEPDYGFGVFAYQTGTAPYTSFRTQAAIAEHYPNFMYNERIIGDGNGGWKYADVRNTKYWPNEVGTETVDDQNNDSGNDPAKTDYTNGGNVSFFAYAPYADFGYSATTKVSGIDGQAVNSANDGTTSGIIAFSGNLWNGSAADKKFSDPFVTYRISNDSKKQVDLLWGTTGTNGVNVLGNQQLGQPSEGIEEYVNGSLIENNHATTPPTIVRPIYNVNTNLTKQKTNGTVDFAFKHALAKIGGSYVGTGDGSDEDGNTPTNGLMVILDIDENGNETGGSLQPYAGTPLETGSDAGKNRYNTKVTINNIVLENEKQLTADGITAIENNTAFDFSSDTYTTTLLNQGLFNLVTGVWHDLSTTGSTQRTHTIEVSDVSQADPSSTPGADDTKDAVLNLNIAEPASVNWTNNYTKAAFELLPIGVTTVAKNVYQSDAQPFVFIPGTKPIIKITVDYTVRTYDAKLAKKYSEVRQKITKNLYILDNIQLNKQYNILIHLGLTSVKFTATVSDWEVTNATGTTTDPGDGTSPVTTYDGEELEHIYLPINVK